MLSYTSLLEAPRSLCPAEVFHQKSNKSIKVKVCNRPTLKNGFCNEHQHVHSLLKAGAAAGYPRLVLSTCINPVTGQEEAWTEMWAGSQQWDKTCIRITPPGEWFALFPAHVERLKQEGKKDSYTRIMDALALALEKEKRTTR